MIVATEEVLKPVHISRHVEQKNECDITDNSFVDNAYDYGADGNAL